MTVEKRKEVALGEGAIGFLYIYIYMRVDAWYCGSDIRPVVEERGNDKFRKMVYASLK
jgi:hypothetical protein